MMVDGEAASGRSIGPFAHSRRSVLRSLPAVAGTLLLGGAAARKPNESSDRPSSQRQGQRPGGQQATPAPSVPVLQKPLFTLADYRRVVPGRPFPGDAVALTIDDGPHPEWTPRMLRLLDKYNVPALFCMIGNQVLGHEKTARSVAHMGHHIANHSWSHPGRIARLPGKQVDAEINRAQDKIYSSTGQIPTLFRAPGGAWSTTLAQAAARRGVLPLDWSDDPRDWTKPGVPRITRRLLSAKPGQILLCHDGGGDRSQTLAALQIVIPALQARGYRFVALNS